MHLFTQAVGLKSLSSRPAMDLLLKNIIQTAVKSSKVEFVLNDETQDGYYEAQIKSPMLKIGTSDIGGISVRGLYNPITGDFKDTFYFPYIESVQLQYYTEITIERQNDREAYLVHCLELTKEVSPIFYLENTIGYMKKCPNVRQMKNKIAGLAALATEGKVVFPIKKTEAQLKKITAASEKRDSLVSKAMKGDTEALDSLTIGDFDTYADVLKRIKNEDILSVVESSFIPSGLECDIYNVVGEISDVKVVFNSITSEEVYYLQIECNDVKISLGIHKEDLLGVPQKGYRFIGRIWLMGTLYVDL